MAWVAGMRDIKDIADKLADGSLGLVDIAFFNPLTSTRAAVLMYSRAAYPLPLLTNTTGTEAGDAYYVEHWPQALLHLTTSGSGVYSVKVDVQGRLKDGDWFGIPDSTGTAISFTLTQANTDGVVLLDLTGIYEIRLTSSNPVGDFSLDGKAGGGR
jgi:hypothetical protein